MTRTRYLVAGLLSFAVVAAALTYVGRSTPTGPSRQVPTVAAGALPGVGVAGLTQAPGRPQLDEIERLIRAFDEQTGTTPNATGLAFLGQLELERARLTGDVGSYARAARALEQAVRLAPGVSETQALLASVLFTTHDFTGAFDLASEIYERDGDLGALAVRGDAALELGRYEQAEADYATLAATLPGASSSLVRLARLSFLQGDTGRAAVLAAEAERAAASEGAFGATRAWYAAFRGRLALDAGRPDEAATYYARAVGSAPDYHVAIVGLASARAAQGRIAEAIRLYERATAMVPEPAPLAALGDLYTLQGDDAAAADRYATVEAIASLAEANQLYDRQLASFRADHGGDLTDALRIVEEELRTRRDVYGHDAHAWVLYHLGRHEEARSASDEALALGTPDARLWFHAGMISAALGDDDRAREELTRALQIAPRFDPLLATIAAETLTSLGGAA